MTPLARVKAKTELRAKSLRQKLKPAPKLLRTQEQTPVRHKLSGRQFGRASGPRKAMFRIMVTDLLRHGQIKTTVAKAKEIGPLTEKMITLGKKGSLHDRRQAAAFITDKSIVKSVFDDIAPRFKERAGGYTRITRLGVRAGDAAEMALIELVD
ncbi:50S ribosomal protein L17 [Candidatus Lucifugimonas marina]|uniref:Large ribosomal subunit protein bL17 n=1 Tax=Candidatus Lucifugimonas marina TaxID=3038979 RepID=A0AAJ5ZIZ3_9CHLR|nr:50S ribosomal protein L17 [SAR202 cluster bacterium JH702]MDG0870114.1 50S ribosomal protein L17 [SAR202 cluster bacterium JH639]WFG36327.1 50S ribosomal protein L17 [SAR202 cluster bacterium JH545]WFG40260.1 50S ribosomal protein L17 [SAR202 cluster bacterium JH1073]